MSSLTRAPFDIVAAHNPIRFELSTTFGRLVEVRFLCFQPFVTNTFVSVPPRPAAPDGRVIVDASPYVRGLLQGQSVPFFEGEAPLANRNGSLLFIRIEHRSYAPGVTPGPWSEGTAHRLLPARLPIGEDLEQSTPRPGQTGRWLSRLGRPVFVAGQRSAYLAAALDEVMQSVPDQAITVRRGSQTIVSVVPPVTDYEGLVVTKGLPVFVENTPGTYTLLFTTGAVVDQESDYAIDYFSQDYTL